MSSFIFVSVCGGEDENAARAGDIDIIQIPFLPFFERRFRISSSIFVPVCGGEDEDAAGVGRHCPEPVRPGGDCARLHHDDP